MPWLVACTRTLIPPVTFQCDLPAAKVFQDSTTIQELCDEIGILHCFEVSAKDGTNVEDSATFLIKHLLALGDGVRSNEIAVRRSTPCLAAPLNPRTRAAPTYTHARALRRSHSPHPAQPQPQPQPRPTAHTRRSSPSPVVCPISRCAGRTSRGGKRPRYGSRPREQWWLLLG